MSEVLLTILPPWGPPTVPIGLGYLSQYLISREIDHDVLDLNLEIFNQVDASLAELWTPQQGERWVDPARFEETLGSLEPQVDRALEALASSDARLIGFSVNQSNARLSVEVARRLRARCPDRVLVFGGLGVYVPGERRLIPEGIVDQFVMGEGEVTLLRIIERLDRGEPLEGIAGTVSSPTEEAFDVRAHVDLGDHPWPTYEKMRVLDYPGGGQPMPVGLGRGCVCRCSFCGDYPFWRRYRHRRGVDVVDELEHHLQFYDTRVFEFNDLAINGDMDTLEEMCDGVIARGLNLEWSSYAYLRQFPSGLPEKLRRSGCVMLRFGMESASDSVLKRMRKPHRSRVAAETLAQLSAAGINCNIGLMVGFPDETDAEIEETCEFLLANQRHIHEIDSLSVFYIKPLSDVEKRPDYYGISFPEDHAVRWNHWIGRDGSTYEKRVSRARRMIETLEKTSIRFQRCNIFGF